MTSSKQGWITLDSVINDYLDESEQSIHKYAKCFNLAFRGMEQLGIDFFYQIKSLKLPVLPNKTVLLPPDYINYSKIGVLNSKGEVIPLKYNNKLTNYAELLSNRIEKTQDNTLYNFYLPTSPIFYNYWGSGSLGNLYGVPSGAPFVGNFKIDHSNGVILLDENFFYEYIIIEYVSSPKEGEEYYVPIVFREALIAYLAWTDIRSMPSSRRGNLGDKRDRRHEFYNERRLAQARYRPFYLDEAYQLSLEMTRMCVKA